MTWRSNAEGPARYLLCDASEADQAEGFAGNTPYVSPDLWLASVRYGYIDPSRSACGQSPEAGPWCGRQLRTGRSRAHWRPRFLVPWPAAHRRCRFRSHNGRSRGSDRAGRLHPASLWLRRRAARRWKEGANEKAGHRSTRRQRPLPQRRRIPRFPPFVVGNVC